MKSVDGENKERTDKENKERSSGCAPHTRTRRLCLETNKIKLPGDMKTWMIKHVEIVCAELRSYFNNAPLPVAWHKDLFNTEVNPMAEAEGLAEFKVSNAIRQAFDNKSRNRLDADNDICLTQSKTKPDIKDLHKRGQEQTFY